MKNTVLERARKHIKCPYCNNEVTTIILGEPFGTKYRELNSIIKNENLKVNFLGVFFGDGSDSSYICYNCNREFDKNMKLMEFYECPRSKKRKCILKEECKNYIASNKKSKNFRICKTCNHFSEVSYGKSM